MRKFVITAISLTALTLSAFAQDDAAFKEAMKVVPPALGAIRSAADNDAADATKVAESFDKIAAYFKAKGAADAVTLAETARDAAKTIASGGDKAASLPKIQGTCGACHRAHRDGAAPNFTIK